MTIKKVTINETKNKKFGRLTVLEYVYSKNGRDHWKCKCDCGNELVVMGKNLRNHNTKSCGCLGIDSIRKRSRAKLEVGTKFNRLTIIELDHVKHDRTFWKCVCSCGKTHVVSADKLISGHTKSCGCLRRETTRNRLIGANNHMWKGGTKSKNNAIRDLSIYQEWRNKVFKRDNYTCRMCGKRGVSLEAHHKFPFSIIPYLRFVVWNGITLCKKCHSRLKWHEILFK